MVTYTHRPHGRKRLSLPVEQQWSREVHLVVVSATGAGRFAAHDHAGRLLVEGTPQPLLDSCRVLLGEGVDGNAHVIMRHADSNTDALKTKAGIGAKLSVRETDTDGPRFVRWKPFPSRAVAPRARSKGPGLPVAANTGLAP